MKHLMHLSVVSLAFFFIGYSTAKNQKPALSIEQTKTSSVVASSDLTQSDSLGLKGVQDLEITLQNGVKLKAKGAENLDLNSIMKLSQSAVSTSTETLKIVQNQKPQYHLSLGHSFNVPFNFEPLALQKADPEQPTGFSFGAGARLGDLPQFIDLHVVPTLGMGLVTWTLEL